MIVRTNDLVSQADFPDQFYGPGLGGKETVGSALDDAVIYYFSSNHAAKARFSLDQDDGNAGL